MWQLFFRADDNTLVSSVWKALESFLSVRADGTKKSYESVFRQWVLFLGAVWSADSAEQKIISATRKQATAFISSLRDMQGQKSRDPAFSNQLTVRTIKHKLTILKAIYNHLIDCGLLKVNPFDGLLLMSAHGDGRQKRPTELVPFDAVKELLNLPAENTPEGLRDRAWLGLLFGCGLRRREVLALRVSDISVSVTGGCCLMLPVTKSGKAIEQVCPEWVMERLSALVSHRKSEGATDYDPLFVSYKGTEKQVNGAYSESTLYRAFKSYCCMAGLPKKFSPHSARATAITKLLSSGHNHKDVQRFSRHSSIGMVERYDKRFLEAAKSPTKLLNYNDEDEDN